jgi:hypothetical protein
MSLTIYDRIAGVYPELHESGELETLFSWFCIMAGWTEDQEEYLAHWEMPVDTKWEHYERPTDEQLAAVTEPAPLRWDFARRSEYPELTEQLDMMYWDQVNGTTVWKDTIESIKAKYPKPVESE